MVNDVLQFCMKFSSFSATQRAFKLMSNTHNNTCLYRCYNLEQSPEVLSLSDRIELRELKSSTCAASSAKLK